MPTNLPRAALTPEEAAEYIGKSARSFVNLRKREDFPRPRDLTGSGRYLVFLRAEIDAWLAALPPAPVAPEPAQLKRGRASRAGGASSILARTEAA